MKKSQTISSAPPPGGVKIRGDAEKITGKAEQITRAALLARIEQTAEAVATAGGLELVEVELKGSGHNQLLRITIDKPGGVTHADCEFVSREAGAQFDAEDTIPGSYQLEVSSPGVERKLNKWQDWERFQGKKVKVVLKPAAAAEAKHFEGTISQTGADANGAHTVTVQLADGKEVTVPLEQVDRANLKFEW